MNTYTATEWVMVDNEPEKTGTVMVFLADSVPLAIKACLYTLQLSYSDAYVIPTGSPGIRAGESTFYIGHQ